MKSSACAANECAGCPRRFMKASGRIRTCECPCHTVPRRREWQLEKPERGVRGGRRL